MNTLYIIGNGFDLFHDLPTNYYCFGNYLEIHDCEFYKSLHDWFPSFYNNQKEECFSLWEDFENGLKDIDQELLWQNVSNNLTPYGAEDWKDEDNHRAQYVIHNILELITSKLCNNLANWICSVDVMTATKRLSFIPNAIYLTFNYTKTLELYYKICSKQILHIHGITDNPASIITGHNMKFMKSENDYDDIRMYECERIIQSDYFDKTLKPVENLIYKNHEFFKHLHNISTIKIIGHSINNIDIPYYEEIIQNIKERTRWEVYFKNQDLMSNQLDDKKQTLINLGIKENCIIPYLIDSIAIE